MSGLLVKYQVSISEYTGPNNILGNRQNLQLGSLTCDVRALESKSEEEILFPLLTKVVNQRECIFLEKFQQLQVSTDYIMKN